MIEEPFANSRKKKKVDMEALSSPLKRIPGMDIASVRDLLDLGIAHVEDLRGRSPEALYDDIKAQKNGVPADRLAYFRMAVYFSETDDPEPQLMEAWKWQDSGSVI